MKYLFCSFFFFTALINQALPTFPLSTCKRHIIDNQGQRFKLSSINWYGPHEKRFVVGGLDKRPLKDIVKLIKDIGFNSVRLPFSNQMLEEKKVPKKYILANPQFLNKTPLEVFDAVINALAKENLAIILNNHTSNAIWCCFFEEDGLWYTRKYPESRWIKDWENLIKRYKNIPQVVGADLRNELRPAKYRGTSIPAVPFWGTGSKNDWRRAAQKAGNRLLKINPNLLIIVEGINFPRYHLRGVAKHPVNLIRPKQLVYAAHNYAFTAPNEISGPKYGQMNWEEYKNKMDEEWGFVLDLEDERQAPVWLSEFGGHTGTSPEWFENITRYLKERDIDFAYWPLNSGQKLDGYKESFSLINTDWTAPLKDWRWDHIKKLQKSSTFWGAQKRQECLYPKSTTLPFYETDAFEEPPLIDWSPDHLKATCGISSRLLGFDLDRNIRGRHFKAAHCQKFDQLRPKRILGQKVKSVRLSWSKTQLTCPKKTYARGIAQQKRGKKKVVKELYCTHFQGLMHEKSPCRTLTLSRKGKKMTCLPHEYIKGLTLRRGHPFALKCCQIQKKPTERP
jgi:aryl-phospho-beta-D-glucosidase BglC (GH1 family)